jgi:hypothetical protein
MAQFCRGQSRQIARSRILLLALSLVILSSLCAKAQNLYERPVLVVDPDMHTAPSKGAAADAAGRFLATGSNDKTVRIWSARDGKLLRTIRMPAGPGHIGEINAVAMSPDGNIVAAGGWGEGPGGHAIYLFDGNTGKIACYGKKGSKATSSIRPRSRHHVSRHLRARLVERLAFESLLVGPVEQAAGFLKASDDGGDGREAVSAVVFVDDGRHGSPHSCVSAFRTENHEASSRRGPCAMGHT